MSHRTSQKQNCTTNAMPSYFQ